MIEIKDLMLSVENFINALSYTYHVDEQELFRAVADLCTRHANRLDALDPARNR